MFTVLVPSVLDPSLAHLSDIWSLCSPAELQALEVPSLLQDEQTSSYEESWATKAENRMGAGEQGHAYLPRTKSGLGDRRADKHMTKATETQF